MILIVVFGCQRQEVTHKEQDLVRVKSINGEDKKKVILLVVDSLMAQAIDKGIAQKNFLPYSF